MRLHVGLFGFMASVFFTAAFSLHAQDPSSAEKEQGELTISPQEIIQLAESKIYAPAKAGLKDLFFVQELALNRQVKSHWFKAPNKIKSIFGRPASTDPSKKISILTAKGEIPVEKHVPQLVAGRNLSWFVGNPISCLSPYGKFEIIAKDNNGTQLRFTATPSGKDMIWSHIDFYLDKDFHLVKTMEKMPIGRIEEHDFKLKPFKEGAKLMVIDSEKIITTSEKAQTIVAISYHYAQYGDFVFLASREFNVTSEAKKFVEKYVEYRINEGIDDAVFISKS